MNHLAFRSIFVVMTALLLTISFSATAQDDDGPPGQIAEVWVVSVSLENQPAFEEAFNNHMNVRKEAGDPASWQTFTNNTGDSLSTYFIRNCCFSWADRDAYDAWGEENPEVSADWNENVHSLVSNYGHHFSEVDFENSNWPDEGSEVKFVGVTSYRIKPGAGQQFDAAKNELSQIALNEGWAEAGHNWAWSSSVDGPTTVNLVIPHENYADMANPDPTFFQFLSQHLGSEEAAAEIFQRFTGATKGAEYTIYTHRADMSMSD
jgi:hypothetical protein